MDDPELEEAAKFIDDSELVVFCEELPSFLDKLSVFLEDPEFVEVAKFVEDTKLPEFCIKLSSFLEVAEFGEAAEFRESPVFELCDELCPFLDASFVDDPEFSEFDAFCDEFSVFLDGFEEAAELVEDSEFPELDVLCELSTFLVDAELPEFAEFSVLSEFVEAPVLVCTLFSL